MKTSFPNDSIKRRRTEEELQALIETFNNASYNTNSETEDDSYVENNDPLLNDSPPAINFVIQKKDESAVNFMQTDILRERQEQVRKHNEC